MQNTPAPTSLPPALIDSVKSGNAILFLGSGASIGATHPQSEKIPTTEILKNKLCEKFLNGSLKDRPLAQVAQFCDHEAGRIGFQTYVSSLFSEYGPAEFHKMLPKFRWHAIATTNYDLIVERAYDADEKRVQELVRFYKDNMSIEAETKKHRNPLQFLKLHGCISKIDDESIPLILATEQYITFEKNRTRMFNRLKDWAHEFPIIFCGYSISDPNIQTVLFDLFDDNVQRPTYFVVQPRIDAIEERYWLSHRITPLKFTFEKFLIELDRQIPQFDRVLGSFAPKSGSTLTRFYNVSGDSEPNSVRSFLGEDVLHIQSEMPKESADPKQYYKGYDREFTAIQENFDVQRTITDTVLSDAILGDETRSKSKIELFVLKGAAGNGKSTVLKRVAWEAAKEFDALVLYLREEGTIRNDQLEEIAARTQFRIFLFVDRAAMLAQEIKDCLEFCRKKKIGITVITAERDGEWNTRCSSLENLVTQTYPIRFFSEAEVHSLLDKLEKHGALGLLETRSYEDRVRAFVDHARRQILVALHEATQGKPFEDIVVDEYERIFPAEAREMYLDVCTLNRFDVDVRAGLISRISDVQFEEFEKRFFKPLESVVYAKFDRYVNDYVYRARHPHVASMVFEQVLGQQEERFEQIFKVFSGINVDYASDNEALRNLIRGRRVAEEFQTIEVARKIYECAHNMASNDAYVFHQEGVLELNHAKGDLSRAERCFKNAEELAPYDKSIQHSIALALRQRANAEQNVLLKRDLRERAIRKLRNLSNRGERHAYELTAHVNVLIDQLKDALPVGDSDGETEAEKRVWMKMMRNVEQEINLGHQLFPNDEHVLNVEATFRELINQQPRAISALESAFEKNPRQEWIGLRLASRYIDVGEISSAIAVLRKVITEVPAAKRAHYSLARILSEFGDEKDRNFVLQHLRSSFSDGDTNYDAQFWYARELYIVGQYEAAD